MKVRRMHRHLYSGILRTVPVEVRMRLGPTKRLVVYWSWWRYPNGYLVDTAGTAMCPRGAWQSCPQKVLDAAERSTGTYIA